MSQFNKVCDTCPLRTKVDVNRAAETGSFGSGGAELHLSDGVRSYDVHLGGSVGSSDALEAAYLRTLDQVERCQGSEVGLLKNKCGAGLAQASRWAEVLGRYESTVMSAEEILPLLENANFRDAMPADIDEGTTLVGDERDFSELYLGYESPFSNCGIRKLSATVRGEHGEVAAGRAVMLDRLTDVKLSDCANDIYRIRIAQSGPSFIFEHLSGTEVRVNKIRATIDRLIAEALFAYLNSDDDALSYSRSMANEIDRRFDAQNKQIGEFITTRLSDELAKIKDQ